MQKDRLGGMAIVVIGVALLAACGPDNNATFDVKATVETAPTTLAQTDVPTSIAATSTARAAATAALDATVAAGATAQPAATGVPTTTTSLTNATSSSGTTIKVVTTMSVLADMIRNVGGERVVVDNIIPLGAGPEDFQPVPQDAQKIASADIVFYNGLGLEDWLQPLFQSAGKADQPRVTVTEGLTPIDVGSDDFKQGNPHLWMSAANGVTYVENIRAGLAEVDPAGVAVYKANADRYTKQLLALDGELKQQAQGIPAERRKLVTNHDAFPYFAQQYGFTIVGSILGNPAAEPSAGDLAKLIIDIKAQNVKAVFTESQFSQKLTESIIKDAGVQAVANLYTDTLGDPNSGVASYADMLRYDMKTIVGALK